VSLAPEHINKLLEQCKKGRASAQQKLYQHLSPRMFGLCLRYAKDYHTAEDLLQDGFIKVFKNLHKFRGEGSFEGWVRRIFVNTAIEYFRRNSNMYPVHEQEEIDQEYFDDSVMDNLLAEDVVKFINELSPGYRTVFNLYVVEGYSHREIAEMLEITEGTSKSQLARARYILQEKIQEANKISIKTGM
jgi:RNA polymerase sigma-70 factor (ECF subfamily)